ncbi:hypothetical protein LB503_002692 [Fusarium chuoi]|nr:hypothetical protein LB503_002692 [Fusarium chuoi]
MATQYELNDMPAAKHPRSTVEDASVSSDQDHMDSAQLAKLGKKSVLKRNFGGWTILGFSCAVLVTWEGTLMNSLPVSATEAARVSSTATSSSGSASSAPSRVSANSYRSPRWLLASTTGSPCLRLHDTRNISATSRAG